MFYTGKDGSSLLPGGFLAATQTRHLNLLRFYKNPPFILQKNDFNDSIPVEKSAEYEPFYVVETFFQRIYMLGRRVLIKL